MSDDKFVGIVILMVVVSLVMGVTKCTMDRNQLAHDTMLQCISQHGTWVSGSSASDRTDFGTCVIQGGGSK